MLQQFPKAHFWGPRMSRRNSGKKWWIESSSWGNSIITILTTLLLENVVTIADITIRKQAKAKIHIKYPHGIFTPIYTAQIKIRYKPYLNFSSSIKRIVIVRRSFFPMKYCTEQQPLWQPNNKTTPLINSTTYELTYSTLTLMHAGNFICYIVTIIMVLLLLMTMLLLLISTVAQLIELLQIRCAPTRYFWTCWHRTLYRLDTLLVTKQQLWVLYQLNTGWSLFWWK